MRIIRTYYFLRYACGSLSKDARILITIFMVLTLSGLSIFFINTYSEGKNTKSEKPTTAQDVAEDIWDGLDKILASGKK